MGLWIGHEDSDMIGLDIDVQPTGAFIALGLLGLIVML